MADENLNNVNTESRSVGYYSLLNDGEQRDWMLGAILITDDLGKPEEFKVTYPVKPTLVQRRLYGDSLIGHVGIELCGSPLYQSLENKPDLLLVSDISFLKMADEQDIICPVVFIEKAGESLTINVQTQQNETPRQTLQSPSGHFQPIHVSYPSSYNPEKQRETATLMTYFFQGYDLIEPFARIEVAISALKEQDTKFK